MKFIKHLTQDIQATKRLSPLLRKDYFWPNMKFEVAEYIARCLDCQQVKTEHQHPVGLLQPLPIPSWKWEIIILDFITGLPRNQN